MCTGRAPYHRDVAAHSELGGTPSQFTAAVDQLRSAAVRPEVVVDEMPAQPPQTCFSAWVWVQGWGITPACSLGESSSALRYVAARAVRAERGELCAARVRTTTVAPHSLPFPGLVGTQDGLRGNRAVTGTVWDVVKAAAR